MKKFSSFEKSVTKNWKPEKHGEIAVGREAMYKGDDVSIVKIDNGIITLKNNNDGKKYKVRFSEFAKNATPFPLKEDAPTNVSGGTGINSPNPNMANIDAPLSVVKRDKFANKEVFDVDDCFYTKCIHGKAKYAKYADYVGSDETGEAIRQYGRANPKSSIIVRNKNTQNMMYLRKINEETGEEMESNHRIDEAKISKRATIRDGENKLDKNIAFHAAWKEIPYGVSFVPASAYDREEFGKSTYRARKGEMKEEIIVKLDPKGMKIYFVDGEHYRNTDEVKWQEPTNLTKLVIYNKSVVENDGVPEINEANSTTKGKYTPDTVRVAGGYMAVVRTKKDDKAGKYLWKSTRYYKTHGDAMAAAKYKVAILSENGGVDLDESLNESISFGGAMVGALLAAYGIAAVRGYYEMTRDTYNKLKKSIEDKREIAKREGKGGILTDYSKEINKVVDTLEHIFNKAKIKQ